MRGGIAGLLVAACLAAPMGAWAQGGEVVEVPLREHGGRLWVTVEGSDGKSFDFLLSTGTAVTVLGESAAQRIGEASLSLEGVPVPTAGAATIPDAGLVTDGKTFDGMVGVNTLNRFDILVDLPRGRLLLKPVGAAVAWEGVSLSDPIRLRVFHGVVLSLDVEVNDVPLPAMLDLGTSRLLANAGAMAEAGIGTEGRARLRVAGATYPAVPVEESDHPILERFSPNGDGFVVVGAPVALDCAVSVSWIHAEMRTCVR